MTQFQYHSVNETEADRPKSRVTLVKEAILRSKCVRDGCATASYLVRRPRYVDSANDDCIIIVVHSIYGIGRSSDEAIRVLVECLSIRTSRTERDTTVWRRDWNVDATTLRVEVADTKP